MENPSNGPAAKLPTLLTDRIPIVEQIGHLMAVK